MTKPKKTPAIVLGLLLLASLGGLFSLNQKDKLPEQQNKTEITSESGVQGVETAYTPPLLQKDTFQEEQENIDKGPKATVIKVVDGDTIEVAMNGAEHKIRIIGINTPESVDPRRPVECFGKEAATIAKQKLNGQEVQLEIDPSQDERDKYGRLLRFVWADNGETNFGAWMIKNGFAYEYTYATPHKYQQHYQQLQNEAETNKRGLWGDTCEGKTQKQHAQTKQIQKKRCSDFISQQEAQAYFEAAGGLTSTEVKGMDGNKDGNVCESLP